MRMLEQASGEYDQKLVGHSWAKVQGLGLGFLLTISRAVLAVLACSSTTPDGAPRASGSALGESRYEEASAVRVGMQFV